MKYVAPAYLIIVFVGFTVQNFGASLQASWASTGSRVAMLTIAGMLAYLVVVTRVGEKRLRAAGVDIDDTTPADLRCTDHDDSWMDHHERLLLLVWGGTLWCFGKVLSTPRDQPDHTDS